jgi:hypothetical protein
VWHPQFGHQLNLARDVGTITTHTGVRKRVIVSAPGFLDAVTVSESSGSDDVKPAAPQPQPHSSNS